MSEPAWPPLVLVAASEDEGKRLDVLLAERLAGFSRGQVRELMRAGGVRVAGRVRRTGVPVAAGATIEIEGVPPPGLPLPVAAPELPLETVLADDALIVVDKPAGMATLPLSPAAGDTLANALVARHPELRGIGFGPLEVGILHRLDTGTSGLVLVGRTAAAFAALAAQLEQGKVEKSYLALVHGAPPDAGAVDWPLAHDRAHRERMVAVRDAGARSAARPASTRYRVVERRRGFTLVEARLHTGARHQVRVHLAAAGFPLAGDVLYGGAPGPVPRHFLHAAGLAFRHPYTGAPVQPRSPLPAELVSWLASIPRL